MSDQKKIVIVDDDAVALRTMKDALSETFKVYGANSGPNALKVMKKVGADLVLLDHEMPEMNGPEVLREMRSMPETALVPVFFLSGAEMDEAEAKAQGALGFIRKGTAMWEILERIGEAVTG